MAVNLSPLGGVGAQFFDSNGNPLSGGLIYTYAAGTSTPAATYTSSSGLIQHSNPIVLDAAGRVPTGEIWLTDGISYKFVLKDSNDALIATYDDISNLNNAINVLFTGVKNQNGNISVLGTKNGSDWIGFQQNGINAVSTNYSIKDKLRQTVSVIDFGATGNGVTDDSSAIQSAIDYAESINGAVIDFPAGTYNCAGNTLSINGNGVTLQGYSATIKDTIIYVNSAATRTSLLGFTSLITTSGASKWHVDVAGTDTLISDVKMIKNPDAGGYQMYIRATSSFGTFRNMYLTGSNGIFVSGHDHNFVNNTIDQLLHGDDAYALKAAQTVIGSPVQTYNISIVGGSISGASNIIGIGSEIGLSGATGDYSSYVKNVTVTGVNAYKCSYLAYIKPGAITPDYRNGLVENIAISNCVLNDPDGTRYRSAFYITAGRGAIVRNIAANNCIIRARCQSPSVTHAHVYIRPSALVASADISDITINNCQFYDAYDGVDNSISTPGLPVDFAIKYEKTNSAFDTISNVFVDNCIFNGTKNGGVVVENSPEGPMKLTNSTLINIAKNPLGSTYSGYYLSTTVNSIYGTTIDVDNNFPVGISGSSGYGFQTKSESVTQWVGSAAAGVSHEVCGFRAPKDCYIWKIELINNGAITQSDTNYCTFTFTNVSTASVLTSVTTKVTGGIAILDDYPANISANALTGANAYLPANGVLKFSKADSGSGQPITDMQMVVYYVEYSQ